MRRRSSAFLGLLFGATSFVAGCSRERAYELRGQVLAVYADRREIVIKHEDIRGFMPGMTMPFKVRDVRMLEGRAPGDLVTARLVVEERDAHLSAIERTGYAPVTDPVPVPPPAVLAPGEEVPDATLVDQDGRTRRVSDWRGRALAVTFTYTRCPVPDFCPLMDRNFAAVQEALSKDPALRAGVHLLSVSFDPQFDTPTVLAAHAARVGANPDSWTLLTGPPDQVEPFASGFGVSIVRDGKSGAEILHNLRTAVIDPRGRLMAILSGNEWQPNELLEQLKRARR